MKAESFPQRKKRFDIHSGAYLSHTHVCADKAVWIFSSSCSAGSLASFLDFVNQAALTIVFDLSRNMSILPLFTCAICTFLKFLPTFQFSSSLVPVISIKPRLQEKMSKRSIVYAQFWVVGKKRKVKMIIKFFI